MTAFNGNIVRSSQPSPVTPLQEVSPGGWQSRLEQPQQAEAIDDSWRLGDDGNNHGHSCMQYFLGGQVSSWCAMRPANRGFDLCCWMFLLAVAGGSGVQPDS